MVDQSDIEIVETTEDHYRFQLRGREQFDETAETPHWAQEAAETVSDGTTVRMGRIPDTDTLRIESVKVPRKPNLGQEGAKDVAEKVVEEIRS
jgi:hypothetical protein